MVGINRSEDLDECVQLFTNKLNIILNVMVPLKRIQVRSNYAPWISDNAKSLIRDRNEAFRIFSTTNSVHDWNYYKFIRNRVTNILRKEKNDWQKAKLNDSLHSPSMWKYVRNLIGCTPSNPPQKIIYQGTLYQKPTELCQVMNKFFFEKIESLLQKIPESKKDPLENVKKMLQRH